MWRAVRGRGCRRSAVGTAAETFPEPEPRSTLGRRGREHGVGKALGAADGGRTVRQASQGATYESDGLTANAAQLGTQRSGRRRRRGTARVDRAAAGRSSERHGSGPDAVFGAHLRRHSARMTAGRARSTLANVEIRELQLGPCGAFNCARNQKQTGGASWSLRRGRLFARHTESSTLASRARGPEVTTAGPVRLDRDPR